jgi:opacity protein-like surface antigen
MTKPWRILGGILLVAAFLVIPKPVKAEMYLETYLGGSQAADLSSPITTIFPGTNVIGRFTSPSGSNPAVIGGLKVGVWFVPTGFMGHNYPDWAKYLGFYTDFSYHRLDIPEQQITLDSSIAGPLPNSTYGGAGSCASWAFMFAGRYGFLPDSEVPFGRLQPYLAVGPAIMFSVQKIKTTVRNANGLVVGGGNHGSQSSVNIGLVVETGLRYMALKQVSLDISFKYRHAAPSYSYQFQDTVGLRGFHSYTPSYDLFSGQLGIAYHF